MYSVYQSLLLNKPQILRLEQKALKSAARMGVDQTANIRGEIGK